MVLGTGLISAFIIAKKNIKATRLQRLQQKLANKPIKRLTFYQFPTKRLFIIFFIAFFIYFLNYFQSNFQNQILAMYSSKLKMSDEEIVQKLQAISKVITWVKFVHLIMILGVVSDLKMKVLSAKKNLSQINIKEYSIVFWKPKIRKISWKIDQEIIWQIVKVGEEKFTQNTSKYGIRMINIASRSSQVIIQRADIFHTRKALIQLSSLFSFKVDLKIH